MSRRWHGRDQLPSDLLWALWSRQSWDLLLLMVSSFCSFFISSSSLGEAQVWCLDLYRQRMPRVMWSVGLPWETWGLLGLGILLASKAKKPRTTICLKGKWFWFGKLSIRFAAHTLPSASELKPTSPKSKGRGKKEGQGHAALACPQFVKLNYSKNAELPFSCLDPWASVSGSGMK